MEDHDDNIPFKEASLEHEPVSEQSTNFLEEIEDFDRKSKDPKYKTYKKSTYWHQQTGITDEVKQETFQKELMACLLRIEALLIKIETLFEK